MGSSNLCVDKSCRKESKFNLKMYTKASYSFL